MTSSYTSDNALAALSERRKQRLEPGTATQGVEVEHLSFDDALRSRAALSLVKLMAARQRRPLPFPD